MKSDAEYVFNTGKLTTVNATMHYVDMAKPT